MVAAEEERLLTTSEFARRVGVSQSAVLWWIRRGRLRAVQPGGPRGWLKIPESELRRVRTPVGSQPDPGRAGDPPVAPRDEAAP